MGIGAQSATGVSQALLDKPCAPGQGVGVSRLLTDEEISRQLADLTGWRRDGEAITASYDAPDFPAAVRLVVAAADEAEQMDHHPDIDLRWKVTHWRLSTHSAGGLTQLDIELAHRIAQAAARIGARAKEQV
jgi:4a-hydroxytetrahydrobiopterin dehydratase